MWKRLFICLIALIGMATSGYAYYNYQMNAAGPSWLNLDTLSVGDKIDFGDTVWDVGALNGNNYTLMKSTVVNWTGAFSNSGNIQKCTENTQNDPVVNNTIYYCEFISTDPAYTNSPLYDAIAGYQSTFSPFEKGKLDSVSFSEGNFPYAFIPRGSDFGNYLGINNVAQEATFLDGYAYWLTDAGVVVNTKTNMKNKANIAVSLNNPSAASITRYPYPYSGSKNIPSIEGANARTNGIWNTLGFRPFALLKKDGFSFILPSALDGSRADITTFTKTSANTDDEDNSLKIRYLDSKNGTVTFQKIVHPANSGKVLTKVEQGDEAKFEYTATASDSNQYISAIFYNKTTGKRYYQKLTTSSGNIVFDTTGLPTGQYEFALVNETMNGTDQHPTTASPFSNVVELEIVEPHKLSYAKTPQSGATLGDYEVSKNVNAGQTVGKITPAPQGVMPLSYTIEANGDNSFQNFEIAGLDSNNASSAASLDVKIKQNAPDLVNGGLKAGTYQFCISAQDNNGYPNTTSTSDQTKVCTSFTVAKTNLTITFDDANQTKKSVSDAATSWSETATATPSTGVKVTYSKTTGDIGLIDIDPNTGMVTYKGNGTFGKVTIRATADDDPATGNDDYHSQYTEKEIVIYTEVDGSVQPDANSSDANIPTFTANSSNVQMGGIIGTIKGSPGTPDNVTIGGNITYTYGIGTGGNSSSFSVNTSTGIITTNANLAVGSYSINVTVSDKWSTKTIPVTIKVEQANAENLQFYDSPTSNTVINTKTVNFTDTNVSVFATVKGSNNPNPVNYSILDGSTNVITIHPTSGAITIKGAGTVTIVATKKGISGQADARTTLTFTVNAADQNFIYTDSTLSPTNELPKNAATGKYNAYEEVYAPGKTFNVYTTGNPPGSSVTYQLKAGSSTDVISVDLDGTVHILNASRNTDIGNVTVEATSHDPSGNYADKTIELPITIKRGTRTVAFADHPIYVINGTGSVTPITLMDGVIDTEGTATIEVDPGQSATAWTNDGHTIQYSYSGDNGIDITISVNKPANRNYEIATGTGVLHILGIDEAMLTVTTPGKIIYGDHFTVRSTQDDSLSTNVQYSFTVDNTMYVSSGTVSGNQAEFDALKFSGNTEITITVTRTADGEVPLSKKVKVKVLPKPIDIKIDDKNKLKGEANPPLSVADFTPQLVSWNGVQDVIQANDIKLMTTANQNSPVGSYPINGDANYLDQTYPNYHFTFLDGSLKIVEENVDDSWYHMETDDGQSYQGDWTKQNVNIVSDHNEYVNLSKDQSTWDAGFVTVAQEGNYEQSFWMKKNSGAITSEKKERVKIDKTAPKVKNIKAKDSNNKLQDIINKLSGGIFFKPGTSFEITTDDTNANLDVSGTVTISYKIYKQENTRSLGTPIKADTLAVANEKASITIADTVGTYEICVTPTDKAGNEGQESCHEVTLKKIDVDVDDDGKPDFNDSDGDGCPDLNIKWKGDDGKWVVINGDRDYDGIPDLNIDRDGDGIPDLNLDTDGDGKPDLNLVILKKSDWKPTICVNVDEDKGIKDEYCTGTSVKAQINVDLDGDQIPDINIDDKGDFKPHINIAKDGETPTINIAIVHDWKPNKDYKDNKFTYDSVGTNTYPPYLNIDTDGDGRPDMNLDLDDDGIADINIDTDGDGIPDVDIDSTGDGKPDINIDIDGDGKPDENIIEITEWKPEHNVDGEFPYDTMIFDEPKEPEKPDDPTDPKLDDTDVKGDYYPGANMGGALTGDSTNAMMYLGIGCMSIGMMLFIIFKRKQVD